MTKFDPNTLEALKRLYELAGTLDSFPVIQADPPWQFKDRGTRLAPDYEGEGRVSPAPYHTMELADICALRKPIQTLAARDSFLFLWAPGAMVLDGTAPRVAREWGFEPKQEIIWVKLDSKGKPRFGGGHYTRICTESLLLCRRGKAVVKVKNENNLIWAQAPPGEPGKRHSKKPDEAYEKIQRLTDGPYLELFARRHYSPEWTCWGDEV